MDHNDNNFSPNDARVINKQVPRSIVLDMNTDTLPVPTAKGNINPRHANPIPADKMGIAREVYFTTGCKPQEPTANNKSNNDNRLEFT